MDVFPAGKSAVIQWGAMRDARSAGGTMEISWWRPPSDRGNNHLPSGGRSHHFTTDKQPLRFGNIHPQRQWR